MVFLNMTKIQIDNRNWSECDLWEDEYYYDENNKIIIEFTHELTGELVLRAGPYKNEAVANLARLRMKGFSL